MSKEAERVNLPRQKLLEGAELPADRKFYANGFTIGISPTDCTIVLSFNNEPIALVSVSHTIAKTLVAQLSGLISKYEERIGQPILTLEAAQGLLEEEQDDRDQSDIS